MQRFRLGNGRHVARIDALEMHLGRLVAHELLVRLLPHDEVRQAVDRLAHI